MNFPYPTNNHMGSIVVVQAIQYNNQATVFLTLLNWVLSAGLRCVRQPKGQDLALGPLLSFSQIVGNGSIYNPQISSRMYVHIYIIYIYDNIYTYTYIYIYTYIYGKCLGFARTRNDDGRRIIIIIIIIITIIIIIINIIKPLLTIFNECRSLTGVGELNPYWRSSMNVEVSRGWEN